METVNKNKYLKKSVIFAGKKVTLFSMDGETWSSRSDELELIKERHEQERASYGGQIKGGPQSGIPAVRHKSSSVKAQYSQGSKAGQGADTGADNQAKKLGAKKTSRTAATPSPKSSSKAKSGSNSAPKRKTKAESSSLRKHDSSRATLPSKKKEVTTKASTAKAALPKPKVRVAAKATKTTKATKAVKGKVKQGSKK